MLSTQYRLRLESICEKIIKGESVELSEMYGQKNLLNQIDLLQLF